MTTKLKVTPVLFLLIVLSIYFPTPSRAVEEKAAESGAAARKIFANAIAAMGGSAALTQIKSLSMLGMTRVWRGAQEFQGSAKYTYLRPDKYRVDVDLRPRKITQAFNGKFGWGMENLKVYPSEINQRIATSMQVALTRGILVLLQGDVPQAKFHLVAREDLEGNKADVVDFEDGSGHSTRFFFDLNSHLPLQAVYADIDADGNPILTTDVFSNYRKVGGVRWPHRVVEYQAGQRKREDIFTEVQVNGNILASFFDPVAP